LSFSQLPPF